MLNNRTNASAVKASVQRERNNYQNQRKPVGLKQDKRTEIKTYNTKDRKENYNKTLENQK